VKGGPAVPGIDGARMKPGRSVAENISNPINLYLTKDIGLFPLQFWVTSLVGAMVRIVYARAPDDRHRGKPLDRWGHALT